jgi:hypothetical protein
VTTPPEDGPRPPAPRISFIVRVARDEAGRLSGIVERVQSGAKEGFHGAEAIGPLIARMAREEVGDPGGHPPSECP